MSKKPKQNDNGDDADVTVVTRKNPHADAGIVGLGFEVFGEGGTVDRHGVITSDLGDGNYLVEYVEPTDPRDALAVVNIGRMTEPSGDRHGPGAWRLFYGE